jgi:hypothetical protein
MDKIVLPAREYFNKKARRLVSYPAVETNIPVTYVDLEEFLQKATYLKLRFGAVFIDFEEDKVCFKFARFGRKSYLSLHIKLSKKVKGKIYCLCWSRKHGRLYTYPARHLNSMITKELHELAGGAAQVADRIGETYINATLIIKGIARRISKWVQQKLGYNSELRFEYPNLPKALGEELATRMASTVPSNIDIGGLCEEIFGSNTKLGRRLLTNADPFVLNALFTVFFYAHEKPDPVAVHYAIKQCKYFKVIFPAIQYAIGKVDLELVKRLVRFANKFDIADYETLFSHEQFTVCSHIYDLFRAVYTLDDYCKAKLTTFAVEHAVTRRTLAQVDGIVTNAVHKATSKHYKFPLAVRFTLDGKYIVKNPESSEEMARVGDHLGNCFAGYDERLHKQYSEGRRMLLLILYDTQTKEPAWAVEFRKGSGNIVQMEGRHRAYPEPSYRNKVNDVLLDNEQVTAFFEEDGEFGEEVRGSKGVARWVTLKEHISDEITIAGEIDFLPNIPSLELWNAQQVYTN